VPPVSNASLQAPHDAGSSQITIHRLNGHNYLQWASSVRLFVAGKGKLGYLDGTTAKPPITDPRYSMWQAEDSMVQSWLVNSMTTEISATFTLYKSSQAVWEAARDMFAAFKNRAAILDIEANLEKV